jgi:hypothetical protein
MKKAISQRKLRNFLPLSALFFVYGMARALSLLNPNRHQRGS